MLTTTQAAERLGVGRSTVNLWCRQGKFPNAEARQEVIGMVWYIPASDLEGFQPPTLGRPPKPKGGTASGPDGRVIVKSDKTTGKSPKQPSKKGGKK